MNSIYSPNQNKFINLFSENGIKILKSYIKHYQTGGSQSEGGETKESPLISQIEKLQQIKYGIYLPDTKENVRFMMIGCWGRMKGDNVTLPRVANDMAENIENHEFVISLGDNFYIDESITEEAFKEIWENNFFGEGKLNLPWYISLGNHAYSKHFCPNFLLSKHFVNRNWTLPSTYWSMIRNKCLFIFLDTTMIAEYFESEKKKKKGKCSEMIIDDLKGKSVTMEVDDFMNVPMNPIGQIKWFQNTLEKYEPDENINHIIVIGHHPIIAHGHKEKNPCIISRGLYEIIYNDCIVEYNKLTSISNKKYIKSYFCADEHNFQHLTHTQSINEGENIDFHFIVAGTGGAENDLYEKFPKNLEKITGKIPTEIGITKVDSPVNICQEEQVCSSKCGSNGEILLRKLITGENGWLSVDITPSEMNIKFNGINDNDYSISI